MKLKLVTESKTYKLKLPPQHQDHVLLGEPFPECGSKECKLQGRDKRIAPDDRAYESDAVAACCAKYIGVLRLEVNTLFGLREDEAVLKGRCRVY